MMAEKVIRGISVLVVSIYVARYLGPEQFGILSYAISFVAIFSGIATLGLDNIVIRNIVRRPDQQDRIIGTAFSLKLIGSFILIAFVTVALQFTTTEFETKILVFIIACGMLFKTFNVVDFFFQAKVKAKYIAFSQLITVITSLSIQITLIVIKAPLMWFAVVIAFEYLLMGTALISMYYKDGMKIFKWKFRWTVAQSLIIDAWPLFLATLLNMIYLRIDQLMIKEMLTNELLGNYAAAVRLSEAWYIIPMTIAASFFPAVIDAKKDNEEIFRERMQFLFGMLFWGAVLISIPTMLLSDHIIHFLYGNKYVHSANVLRIHIWTCLFVFLYVASNKYLLTENLVLVVLFQTAIAAALNIILNLILIQNTALRVRLGQVLLHKCRRFLLY
jgi:O-antigen/teichoic acid export membrane protein